MAAFAKSVRPLSKNDKTSCPLNDRMSGKIWCPPAYCRRTAGVGRNLPYPVAGAKGRSRGAGKTTLDTGPFPKTIGRAIRADRMRGAELFPRAAPPGIPRFRPFRNGKEENHMGIEKLTSAALIVVMAAAATGQLPRLVHEVRVAQLTLLKESQASKWGKAWLPPKTRAQTRRH